MHQHGSVKGWDGTTVLTKLAEDAPQPSNAHSRALNSSDVHYAWQPGMNSVKPDAAPAAAQPPYGLEDGCPPIDNLKSINFVRGYSASPGSESSLASPCSSASYLLPQQSSSCWSLTTPENSFVLSKPSSTSCSSECSPTTLSPEPQVLPGRQQQQQEEMQAPLLQNNAQADINNDSAWQQQQQEQEQQYSGNSTADEGGAEQQQQQCVGDITSDEECTQLLSQQQQQDQQQNAWREVITFALPMLATLAADPLASLVDTAYVGHLGPLQLAGVGMASNIFTSITRLFNAPLLAVTTSSVAAAAAAAAAAASAPVSHPSETATPAAAVTVMDKRDAYDDDYQQYANVQRDDSSSRSSSSTDLVIVLESDSAAAAAVERKADLEQPLVEDTRSSSSIDYKNQQQQKQQQCSGLAAAVSAALWLALAFSLVEVAMLAVGCESLVSVWGAPASSPLHTPTQQFLFLRGLAAPITVLLLVLQGIFRGLKDASTPLYATIACSALNIALEPAFIFEPLKLGVRGSALATALAQSLPLIALFMVLQRKYGLHLTKLLTRGLDWHSLGAMFAPTGFLLLRTVSISAVFATATSLVARAGPLAAAAHQVAFQIWLASSLLADSLAVACQTLLARSTAAGELRYARKLVVTSIVMATSLGVVLAVALGAGMHVIPGLFSDSPEVLKLAGHLMPIVAFTQPLNALAFVLDGVLYGAGGFKYASAVMLLCASPSLGLMFAGQGFGDNNTADHSPPHAYAPAGPSLGNQTTLLQQAGGLDVQKPANLSFSQLPAHQAAYTLITPSQQGYSTAPILMGIDPAAAAAGGSSNQWAAAAAAAVGGGLSSSIFHHDESEIPAAVLWVWAGLVMLMVMRAVTILVPLAFRCYPFHVLYADKKPKQQQQQQPQQQTGQRTNWILRTKGRILNLRPWPAAGAAVGGLREPLLPFNSETCDTTAAAAAAAAAGSNRHGSISRKQQILGLKPEMLSDGLKHHDHDDDPDELSLVCGDSPGSSSSSSSSNLLSSSLGSSRGSSSNSLHAADAGDRHQ